jgi:hypothetical protein
MLRHYNRDSNRLAILFIKLTKHIQIGTAFLMVRQAAKRAVSRSVITYLKLLLTHAALAPAINQMGGCEAAFPAPCFSMR